MYPIQCKGGFSVPAKGGKFEVCGMAATVNDTTAASRFAIVDDPDIKSGESQGFVLDSLDNKKVVLADIKGVAGEAGILELMFPDPIKTRHGISVYHDNLRVGSVIVYVR